MIDASRDGMRSGQCSILKNLFIFRVYYSFALRRRRSKIHGWRELFRKSFWNREILSRSQLFGSQLCKHDEKQKKKTKNHNKNNLAEEEVPDT